MGRNKVSISGNGFYALEVFDVDDVKQHKALLQLENQKQYSQKMLSNDVYLYLARRNTRELNTKVKSKTLDTSSGSRSEALQQVLLQAAESAGIREKVESYLKHGKVKGNFGRLELEFLRIALEHAGWTKDRFVFD